jgi:hypothetical protein
MYPIIENLFVKDFPLLKLIRMVLGTLGILAVGWRMTGKSH